MPIPWPLILYPRPKCAFSEAGLLGYWCQGAGHIPLGKGVVLWRGGSWFLPRLPKGGWGGGAGGTSICHLFLEKVKRCR